MAKRLCAAGAITAVLLIGSLVGVGQAHAGTLGCNYPDLSQPFLAWGDSSAYYLDPGGNFEGWTTPWRLASGARLSSGSESFSAAGGGTQSLYLPQGAWATGPASCIFGLTDHTLRMFARSATSAPLRVDVMVNALWLPLLGNVVTTATTFYVGTTPDWQPTQSVYNLLNLAALLNLSGNDIYLRLSAPAGPVQVDDVFIDPRCEI